MKIRKHEKADEAANMPQEIFYMEQDFHSYFTGSKATDGHILVKAMSHKLAKNGLKKLLSTTPSKRNSRGPPKLSVERIFSDLPSLKNTVRPFWK